MRPRPGALLDSFFRRLRLDRERVQASGNLVFQEIVHGAMPFDPALAPKCVRHHHDPHMGGPARYRSGMTGMAGAFVDHFQATR